jgi:hypothetical protein
MECIKEEGSNYCTECDCTEKRCFRCGESKQLKDFDVSEVAHVRRIRANKERVYLCKKCVPIQKQELIDRYGE